MNARCDDGMSLTSLKSLMVIAIVDNEAGDNSSPCSCMTPVKGLSRKSNLFDPRICTYTQETVLSLEHHTDALPIGNMCQAAHGLSLLLIAEYDDKRSSTSGQEETHTHHTRRKYLLFDAGPNPELWTNNAQRLHIPLHDIDAIVLSHYHIDHSGGLRSVIPQVALAKTEHERASLLVDLHSDYVSSRGVKIRGKIYPMTPTNPSPTDLLQGLDEKNKALVHVATSKSDHVICDGCFYISGEIPRITPYEVCRLILLNFKTLFFLLGNPHLQSQII